jgi:hypothetical protein
MSALDKWLLRAAAVAVVLLALYVYSGVLVDHLIWKMQITQAVNGLGQAAKPGGLMPKPTTTENSPGAVPTK